MKKLVLTSVTPAAVEARSLKPRARRLYADANGSVKVKRKCKANHGETLVNLVTLSTVKCYLSSDAGDISFKRYPHSPHSYHK